MESKLSVIELSCIKRRIKRELMMLITDGICEESSIVIIPKAVATATPEYTIGFTHKHDQRYYEFHLSNNYPFIPPRVTINHHPIRIFRTIFSDTFNRKLLKYTGIDCFCCKSILCNNNWCPRFTCKDVLDDIDFYRKSIRQIIHRILVDVIKRKYLIDDIPIIEWLYG